MGVNTDGVQMPPFAQHVAEGGVAGDCFRAAVATDVAVQAENVVACSHHQMQVVADHQDGGAFAAPPLRLSQTPCHGRRTLPPPRVPVGRGLDKHQGWRRSFGRRACRGGLGLRSRRCETALML